MPTYDDEGFDADEARRDDRGGDSRRRGGRHLPGVPLGRHLARVRGLPRAPAGRHLRARGHEARALGEAAPRPPALLLRRAARADPGPAARARPRRARHRRAGDVPDGRVHRLLPALARAVPRRARRGRQHRDLPLALRPLRDLRLPAPLPAAARGRRPPRHSSPGSDGSTPSGSSPRTSPRSPRSARPRPRRESTASARRRSRGSGTRPSSSSTSTGRASAAVDLLPDEEDRGFRLLPPPSPGDVWLDLEGHPFYEAARGLEYLFG